MAEGEPALTDRTSSYNAVIADIQRAINAAMSEIALRIAEDTGREAEASAREAGVEVVPTPEKPNLTPELFGRIDHDIGAKASGLAVATLLAGPLGILAGGVIGAVVAMSRRNRLGLLKRRLELQLEPTTNRDRVAGLDDEEKVRLLLLLEALRTLLQGRRNGDHRRAELAALRVRYENYLAGDPPSYVEPTIDRALDAINDWLARA